MVQLAEVSSNRVMLNEIFYEDDRCMIKLEDEHDAISILSLGKR